MAYSVTTNYDSRIPSWPGNGTPFTLIACHDTEGGQGRAGALGTIQFLIDRADRGASYHEMWWYHESTDDFGVIRIVPSHRAAGSIAPHSTVYQPTTWVKNAMGANWWDPNQGAYAVSIAGRVADVDRYARNPKFLAHAHRRMMELWKELGINKRAEHFQFQPSNRTDWGKVLMPALGGLVTSDSYKPPVETVVTTLMPVAPIRVTIRPETTIRLAPDLTTAGAWVVGKTAVVTVIAECKGVDFGSGPRWLAYVISTGGLRYFHEQDVVSSFVLGDTSDLDAKIASLTAEVTVLKSRVASLNATVNTQSGTIAGLKTELGVAKTALATAQTNLTAALEAKVDAEAAAAEASEAAESALLLREALRNFMG